VVNGPILPDLGVMFEDKDWERFDLLKSKPDIIHCSYLPYTNLIYALMLGKLWKIPIVVTPFLHESNIRYQDQSIFLLLSQFDSIFACTDYEAQIYIKKGISKEKINVIPMGVDFHKFSVANDKSSFVEQIFHLHHPLVLFCGYKNYEKGALTLLDAIPLILQINPGVEFMFIGPSTIAYNYTLKKVRKSFPDANIYNLTPENLSGVFDPKKIGAFQYADLFCMPSRSDAYGIVYLEAWATKTPVIGANFPQMHEVIKDNYDGRLIEFDNPSALANLILEMLSNPKLLSQMGENGYNKVIPNQSWTQIGQQIYEIYDKLVSANNQSKTNH
jgi:glycosyltransferase involved in cell wall biosynthesis